MTLISYVAIIYCSFYAPKDILSLSKCINVCEYEKNSTSFCVHKYELRSHIMVLCCCNQFFTNR